ncbi:UCH-domain-containing protein [Pleurotus eryngii]|uniref:ubiquitinyl hydrolase 1 n=1 Tax=Pleurotus eryngii TaxID=5323 RepID=A0A9P6A6Y1_PLEER|nr:UCH-domain-containing protein [Pleurotus eryngii]
MDSLPSPALSPPLMSADSRKRQRSHSMESVPTSPKRQPTPMVLDPVDAYMETQQEPQIVLDSQTDPRERWAWADKAKDRPMQLGETWYVVSKDWWTRWRKGCTGEIDKDGPLAEKDVGPVNNTGILSSVARLQVGLIEGIDVEYVPAEVWNALQSWYGPSLNPLPRKVIERGEAKQVTLELYPSYIKVLRLVKSEPSTATKLKTPPTITISTHESVNVLLDTARSLFSDETAADHRVWKVDTALLDVDGPEFPISELKLNRGSLIEPTDKTITEVGLEFDDLMIIEFKDKDGNWMVNTDEIMELPLFPSDAGFFQRMDPPPPPPPSALKGYTPSQSKQLVFAKSNNARKGAPGTLGLGNMGNTCFMNSALQCLAHEPELTEYFLCGVFERELNPDNPLGMHGAIAEAFGALLHRIWDPNPSTTSYSPREFKVQLQRFAPQFSGYQQHDSQELVAFLLDGLHEDLNRVLKKPYVEKPDWEGGGDVELARFAQQSWEGYMKRNDSVIVDLFQGQYQSTLVCPECKKVSITFDPFMYLTLPLPVDKKWRHTIYYIPWDVSRPHMKVPIELSHNASFKEVRQLLGRWMDATPENLLTLEIFSHRFYKNLDDDVACGDMSDNDTIVCFELPCPARQSKAYKKKPDDPFILPLYLYDASPMRNSYSSRTIPCFGYPAIVVLPPQHATDVNAIREQVVRRMERWTKQATHLYSWELSNPVGSNDNDGAPIQVIPSSVVPPVDTITEIRNEEDGAVVVKVEEVPSIVEEGDIVDEKGAILDKPMDAGPSTPPPTGQPVRLGAKWDTFTLRLQPNHKDFGTSINMYSNNRFETWEARKEESESNDWDGVLLRDDDAIYCEFDENMKVFFFGDERSRWENAKWDEWETYIHPEYAVAKKADGEKNGPSKKGLDLRDCLDEFTKEEQLGEDDLWYCPKCKKHQQATKKFDLWSAPDILVVHLKRFSNSRMLRDKIDVFVDFPVEGLDLEEMVGERKVAKRLMEQGGVDLDELGIGDLEEPLVYDLFGVDEHMGGLGGGHYRAYALNHETQKWYHFDDSFVTEARPEDAVNANAYLLFYRRRSSKPLGGESYTAITEWREKSKDEPLSEDIDEYKEPGVSPPALADDETIDLGPDASLPTPPSENEWTVNKSQSSKRPDPKGNTFLKPRTPIVSLSRRVATSQSADLDGASSSSVEAEPDVDMDRETADFLDEPDEESGAADISISMPGGERMILRGREEWESYIRVTPSAELSDLDSDMEDHSSSARSSPPP